MRFEYQHIDADCLHLSIAITSLNICIHKPFTFVKVVVKSKTKMYTIRKFPRNVKNTNACEKSGPWIGRNQSQLYKRHELSPEGLRSKGPFTLEKNAAET